MIEKYLIENGERITDSSQLVPGEIYAVGSGKEGYRGFLMPGKEELKEDGFGDMGLRKISTYHVPSNIDKGEVETTNLSFDPIIMGCLGVIRPYEGSEMRRSIEEGLEIVSERAEERESEPVSAA